MIEKENPQDNDIQKSDDYLYTETLKKASLFYGATLPQIVAKRLENELNYIINNGFSSNYMIAHLITKYVNDNGLYTCSRGSVGASFVAFLLGITNVNPLPPHYYCPNCKHTEFVLDNSVYSCYDLPEKECPICRSKLSVDGNNIPYEFFMGVKGDELAQIKLNVPLSFEDNVLQYIGDARKTDILGFVPLEILSLIQKYTKTSIKDIDFTDSKIYQLFTGSYVIGINSDKPATLGIPEFGIKFVCDIIQQTKPKNFGDLVRISGLSHGKNIWLENAEILLASGICNFRDLPTSSEDVYKYLTSCGIERAMAFRIAEAVRKGVFKRNSLNKEQEIIEEFDLYNIPEWYIELLCKVSDMLPKAHSVEYAKLAFIFAWYKIYYPVEFYTATFNIRYPDKHIEFFNKSDRNLQIPEDLDKYDLDENRMALFKECTERGIVFEWNENNLDCSKPYSAGNGKILVNYK